MQFDLFKRTPTTCIECGGTGRFYRCVSGHVGNCPCQVTTSECDHCEGEGEYLLCTGCGGENRVDDFQLGLCDGCKTACPHCENGFEGIGELCSHVASKIHVPLRRTNVVMELAMSKRLTVYSIKEKEGKKSYFMKLGIAFENKDGSFNLFLDALPTDGKLHLREDREKTDFTE